MINEIIKYPQLYYPDKISRLLTVTFEPPSLPISPTLPIKEFDWQIKLMFLPIGLLLIFFNQTRLFGIISIIISLIMIFKNTAEKEYQIKLKHYRSQLLDYDHKMKEYRIDKEFYDNCEYPENYQSYQRNKVISTFFSNITKHSFYKDYKKGLSHNFFKNYLSKKFGKCIFEDVSIIDNSHYSNKTIIPYVTDFAYICEYTGLTIEIEIDEPYTLTDKKPIHIDDNKRNNFFLEHNWVIIRFAEEQILTHPQKCCDYIDEVINCFHNNILGLKNIKTDLKPIKAWNSTSVKALISENYRQQYLNDHKTKQAISKMFGFANFNNSEDSIIL